MNYKKILLALISSLFVLIIISYVSFTFSSFILTNKELLSTIMQFVTLIGTLISAAIVIASYVDTNKAFVLSRKPYLLIRVYSEVNNITRINYVNTSQNAFYDLSISVVVRIKNKQVDLSNLFEKNMFMASQDSRDRRFNLFEELKKHNIRIKKSEDSTEIFLSISYSHTFNNKKETINVQKYKLVNGMWYIS